MTPEAFHGIIADTLAPLNGGIGSGSGVRLSLDWVIQKQWWQLYCQMERGAELFDMSFAYLEAEDLCEPIARLLAKWITHAIVHRREERTVREEAVG